MKIIIAIYITLAIFYWVINIFRKNAVREWVPKEFCAELKECSLHTGMHFLKGSEVPPDKPTILIIGKLKTTNNKLILLDIFSNVLTFGFLRFDEILPVGEPTRLRLYFKNVSRISACIHGGVTNFFIIYPDSKKPDRIWKMKIPDLTNFDDGCFIESKNFFSPELPGAHELLIGGSEGIVVAGPFGIRDRKYRIADPGAPWKLPFHVSSGYEYKAFLIALCALAVAIVSMAISIIGD